jgi:Pyruvate/2-oxoacid:ferredoxin oxidoreductase delta subunit
MKIYINNKKCTGCEKCKAACPKGPRVYSIEKSTGKKVCTLKDPSYCLGCRMCVTVCMEDAIALEN